MSAKDIEKAYRTVVVRVDGDRAKDSAYRHGLLVGLVTGSVLMFCAMASVAALLVSGWKWLFLLP